MADFRFLSPSFCVSPQVRPEDLAAAAQAGCSLIINNRPDNEEPGQPGGAQIAAAAKAAGLAYRAIPVDSAGLGPQQVAALQEELRAPSGVILAFCRSGTRSTLLWALAQAGLGEDPDTLAAMARTAGYDVAPVRAAMEAMAARFQEQRRGATPDPSAPR